MNSKARAINERIQAVLRALDVLSEKLEDADRNRLHAETRRGYHRVLRDAADAGLLDFQQRVLLAEIVDHWHCYPIVVRELVGQLVSDVLQAYRSPGLRAVAELMQVQDGGCSPLPTSDNGSAQ